MVALLNSIKALRRKRTKELIEDVACFSSGYEWDPKDKAAGIVRGVKILGYESCHGYGYTAEAMKNAASLYEGRAINIDHPERKNLGASRSYRDRFGKLHNVRYVEGKGLFGDLHYNKKHPIAEQFEYDVEHDPSNLGLSHNASGIASADGKFVESITSVRSVDLVADPATNVSLFESKGERRMALKLQKKSGKTKSKQQIMAEFMENLSEHEDLAELLEAAAVAPSDDESPAVETPLQATAKMAAAIFMDESMDVATKRAKIMKLLDLIDETNPTAGADGQSGDAGAEGETPVKESKGEKPRGKFGKPTGNKELVEDTDDIIKRLARLERKEEIRSLCESKKFQPSPVQLKSLMSLEDDSEVEELIESWAGQSNDSSGGLGPKGSVKPKSKPASGNNKFLLEGSKAITDDELKSLLV
jgi:hypothetical protein